MTIRSRHLRLLPSIFAAAILCSAQAPRLSEAFTRVIPVLQTKTSVPVRLPSHVPDLDAEKVYAITTSVDETGYVVVLGATPDCQGQHVCSYGSLIGTTRTENDIYSLADRKRTAVMLRNGIKGYFYKMQCGAYCGDSLIVWSEGKYHYTIGLKAERMIAVANSAIESAKQR